MRRVVALARAWKKPLVVVLAALTAATLWFAAPSVAATAALWSLPQDQARVVREIGPPSYFTISYLPLGERGAIELVRCEVWYYPEHWQRVSFVSGEVVSVDDVLTYESRPANIPVRPWQITATTTFDEIVEILGSERAEELDAASDARRDSDAQVYATGDAVFAFEREALVFFQFLADTEDL